MKTPDTENQPPEQEEAGSAGATCSAMNRWERARQAQQHQMLSQSREMQEERIAAHYTAFASLAMQLRQLTEVRKLRRSEELDDVIKCLTGKIREGHLMEFGIELEWPNDQAQQRATKDEPSREDATGALADAHLFGGVAQRWHSTTLECCPPGLFLFESNFGFKTQYSDRNGPEAYCVISGEYFWGGTNGDARARRMLMVTPVIITQNGIAQAPAGPL